MELYTEIEIQATADRVWQHLTDLVLAKDLNTKVIHGFELMNRALKARAESSES